ncbi:hypothetical protein Q3G72_014176 [Acer saccharum]|nr:hypothetical protein Q3G72_014176 [Acer saccharum]
MERTKNWWKRKVDLNLTSYVRTEVDAVTLSVMSDDDVKFVIIQKEKVVDSSDSIDTSGRSDSSKTSDTEDESGGDDNGGLAATILGIEEQGVSGTPN